MLTKNANFKLNTMLTIAFLSYNKEYESTRIYASGKLGKFNNFLRFRALFDKI